MAGHLARRAVSTLGSNSSASICSSSLDVQKRPSYSKPSSTRLFSKSHEWVIIDGRTGIVGITEHAKEELGEVVFIETPQIGTMLLPNTNVSACLESTKAAHDICSSISGRVTEINLELLDNPSLVNEDPLKKGWLYKVDMLSKAGTHELMDSIAYRKFLDDTKI